MRPPAQPAGYSVCALQRSHVPSAAVDRRIRALSRPVDAPRWRSLWGSSPSTALMIRPWPRERHTRSRPSRLSRAPRAPSHRHDPSQRQSGSTYLRGPLGPSGLLHLLTSLSPPDLTTLNASNSAEWLHDRTRRSGMAHGGGSPKTPGAWMVAGAHERGCYVTGECIACASVF